MKSSLGAIAARKVGLLALVTGNFADFLTHVQIFSVSAPSKEIVVVILDPAR
jgi:uncharacterized membrane-anchored protein